MEEGKQKETYKRGEKKTRHARRKHFRRQSQNNLEIKKTTTLLPRVKIKTIPTCD